MISQPKNQYKPDYATSPGEILEETLDALGIKKKDFAESCGLSTKHVSQIISGKASVTPETAIRFERVLGIAGDVWNNLEANYRAFQARKKAGQELEKQVAWADKFPVKELIRRGLIEKPKDRIHAVELVLRFFGVASIEVWEERYALVGAAFRHSPVFKSELESLATWLRIGELLAQGSQTSPYDRDLFMKALLTIRSFTNLNPEEFEPKIKALCGEAGVALVFVPEFPKTHVSGASRWLTPEKALIQLSLRHKTNDHFWFSFFHEGGHILTHSKKGVYINEPDAAGSEEEIAADAFAERILIPPKEYKGFVARKSFSRTSINLFSEKVGVAPGIVVGRLQREKHIPFSWLNDLKRESFQGGS
ncbi:MAG: HigA family addiction module antitoxin [Desulfomonilaceae bacterium]|nr:HigA family addiction module antitoxin [Desulfomonilaceae bacterium]